MKSSLVIKLVEAHSSGSEDAFKKAVDDLVRDEEIKGNIPLSASIRNAYASRHKTRKESPMSEMTFSAQSIAAPKDRDSTLELIEILTPKIRLSDVALPEKTRNTLLQIIDEQKNTSALLEKGLNPTNRVLFCGPPGCGKTMSAYALAGELGIPVAYVRLDGLVSSYLGQTGTNLRKIFEYVKNGNIMLFLDEFDAIAKKRDDSNELGELKRIVTTLLQNMDSMPMGVFLVAATNHQHLLDTAIWRRFNISILLDLPNEEQRKQIIVNFLDDYSFNIDTEKLVLLSKGMSGAQINTLLQSLAKDCLMSNTVKVTSEDITRVLLKQFLYINEDSDEFVNLLRQFNNNGLSLRDIEKITGIPKATISYKLNKEKIS